MSVEFKTYGGCSIIVNDPSLVDSTSKLLCNFDERCRLFHQKLLSMGVKAYRCNDGWVDRDRHIITFFEDEVKKGYYMGNMNLKEGDKIFIGNESSGGQFAIIDKVIDVVFGIAKYHYNLIDEYLKQQL